MSAALYETTVGHVRNSPLHHAFRYSGYTWLVDLDDLPALPRLLAPFARFSAADHFGDPARSLRSNVDALLASHTVDLTGGRVLMLAHPRVLGHVFNPLSVFWCWRADGTLACTLAEVHNTYGGRHVYLLHPDAHGRARTAKRFYVSPFHPVDGEYHLRLPVPADTLDLAITLHRPGARPFAATLRGRRRPATTTELLRLLVRYPWTTLAVSLRIRWQGVALALRRLPTHPRPLPEVR